MRQTKQKKGYLTSTYNPDHDEPRGTVQSKSGNKSKYNHNLTIQRLKMRSRGSTDASLDFQRQYSRQHNETNPNIGDIQYNKYFYKESISPRTKMILQSEAQFMDQGRRTEHRQRQYGGQAEENSVWDTLSRIFSFGCIETNHNNGNRDRRGTR